jgi:aromatic ring-opening dioxygenase LigB subunit
VLVAAALCPHPPLLVPEIAAGAAAETSDLRAAALDAVRALVAADPDTVVVIGTGPAAGTARPGETGTLAGFGVDLTVALGDGPAPSEPRLPLSLTLGAWLLREAGYAGGAHGRAVSAKTAPAELAELGERIAAWPARTALLVMGDGTAALSEKAPGYLDPRAAEFDSLVAKALAEADAEAILRLDPVLAGELLTAGLPAWQVLAGAVRGGQWQGTLRYSAAPYGVAYHVASWEPAA